MKEQSIQSRIIKHLESLGAYVVKVSVASKSGVPDILACYNGKFIAVEVKTPLTRLNTSELQRYNLERIKDSGGCSFVAWDIKSLTEGLSKCNMD